MKKFYIILGLVLLTSAAHAQTNRTSVDAHRVFDEMRAKYSALETHSVTMTRETITAKRKPDSAVTKFWFRQPNRYAVRTKYQQREALSVSNGRTSYYYIPSYSKTKYFSSPMPPERIGKVGLMQYQSPLFFTPILAGVDPFAPPWGEAPRSITFGRPATVNNVAVETIVVRLADSENASRTYFIGKKDGLLHRISHSEGKGDQAFSIVETYKDVQLNPRIPIDTFAFVPPPNTHYVDEIKEFMPDAENFKFGSVPPLLAGPALKDQTIRLEDYKGKVVLLDFWATWCGPCIADTPHIKAAYEKFHDQGFEIIGISFDKDRKALEKYIREKNLPWPQIFDGKMFDGEASKNFKIHGIPAYFLIGRDGKIAAIQLQKLLLEPAIEKALSAPTPK